MYSSWIVSDTTSLHSMVQSSHVIKILRVSMTVYPSVWMRGLNRGRPFRDPHVYSNEIEQLRLITLNEEQVCKRCCTRVALAFQYLVTTNSVGLTSGTLPHQIQDASLRRSQNLQSICTHHTIFNNACSQSQTPSRESRKHSLPNQLNLTAFLASRSRALTSANAS